MLKAEIDKELKIEIDKEKIDAIDLSMFKDRLIGASKRHFFDEKEHYKLLAYLSTHFDDHSFADIGTCNGGSATALSYNQKNVVISFDIFERCEILSKQSGYNGKELPKFDNVDFIQTNNFMRFMGIYLNCPIIVLDIDHSGDMERQFIDKLMELRYCGLLLMDDIHQFEGLTELWNSIALKKYDLTKYGHWSGTGLVNFDPENIEIVIK